MVINKILLFIIASVSITSCMSLKHGKKIITKDLHSKSFVIYESDEVELWFDKEEIFLLNVQINKIKEEDLRYSLLAKSIKIEAIQAYHLPLIINTAMASPEEIRMVYSFFMEAQYELMKKGRVKVFNKKNGKFEKYFFCKQYKDKLNTTSDIFKLPNGLMFYSFLLAFGE
jgi:hypothetical protein